MDNGRTRVLTERKYAFDCSFGVTEELQCYILIVFRGFRVAKYGGNLLVVCATQHELNIVKSLLCKKSQGFF